jgi:hypothetical protein
MEEQTMKKIYQNPEIKVIKMQVTHLCEPSIQMYGKNATGAGMSREGGNNFWDDDDEEDY